MQRDVEVRVEVVHRLEPEDAALPARVGRLQHGGEADGLRRGQRLAQVARGREARLRHSRLGEPAPHRDLVRHQVRGVVADSRQAERLRDGGDDGHGAVGRDGEDAVHGVAAADLDHALDVLEVDRLAGVGDGEPERVRIPVDGDDAQAELLRAHDRAPLVAARADEQNRLSLHRRRCYLRGASVSFSRRTSESTSVSSPLSTRRAKPLRTIDA